jgi:DNA polymerase-3 subunit epsilon
MHKLRVPDLAHAPPLSDAIDLVFEAVSGRVPVFHTAVVERTFLNPAFARRGLRVPEAADTEVLGRLLLRDRDGVAANHLPLRTLADILGLPAEPAHHALGDALTTAAAFIALATHLDARRPETVGSLLRADERLSGPRRLA